MQKTKQFKLSYLVLGIFFIFVSILSFQRPDEDLLALAILFGITALLKGIFEIVAKRKVQQLLGISSGMLYVIGAIDIIIGLMFLFNLAAGMAALPFIFAIWFTCDSVYGLFELNYAKKVGQGYYWFSLIINILGIVIGTLLFFNPIASALTVAFLVGFYLMLAGISYIMAAF
ncbi:hypothetical protein CBF34_08220 [Vagococcus penaei]|uniref:Uncharacterized protein n=1 Tax=Vagococcus penaei TaxID=633807 RepID=A0A1Q2D5I0_9ENTE|nr:DUF308 domain-containing protein [Vagococcus penaei]AQP53477.1 hypothetical protein BW732_03955 [Vagococcus penaei]RSU00867.1 hypothetical protein CBF34_08220 [Vagococcus penaei]